MDTKFTPGPWTVENNGGRGSWVKGANGEWSALSCGNSDEAANANARLIVAAPDMYEALQAMLRHSCVADSAPEDKDEEDHAAERKARAALAKATTEI